MTENDARQMLEVAGIDGDSLIEELKAQAQGTATEQVAVLDFTEGDAVIEWIVKRLTDEDGVESLVREEEALEAEMGKRDGEESGPIVSGNEL